MQHTNMATETEWNCPICRDIPGEIASVTPCVHLFCLGCIVRWAKTKPSCPLCRQAINSIIYSVRSEEDFLEIVLPSPSDSSAAHHQDEQGAAEPMPRAYVAGYPPEVWAGFFQDCSEILKPLLPWLNQELSELLRTRWWEVALAQSAVVANLCRYGLSEEALAERAAVTAGLSGEPRPQPAPRSPPCPPSLFCSAFSSARAPSLLGRLSGRHRK
uniref:RING-type E3 ubiquitin transferase n=1 Tax=Geospiza parvula TaxID=87175 RepID=A0A8C3M5M0_GEOPR